MNQLQNASDLFPWNFVVQKWITKTRYIFGCQRKRFNNKKNTHNSLPQKCRYTPESSSSSQHNSNTAACSPTLRCLKIIRFKVFNLAKSIFSLLLYIQQFTSGRSGSLKVNSNFELSSSLSTKKKSPTKHKCIAQGSHA